MPFQSADDNIFIIHEMYAMWQFNVHCMQISIEHAVWWAVPSTANQPKVIVLMNNTRNSCYFFLFHLYSSNRFILKNEKDKAATKIHW